MAISRSTVKTAGIAALILVAARFVIERVPVFAPLRGVI